MLSEVVGCNCGDAVASSGGFGSLHSTSHDQSRADTLLGGEPSGREGKGGEGRGGGGKRRKGEEGGGGEEARGREGREGG